MSEFIVELTEDNRDRILWLCDGIHNEIVRCKDCKHFTENEVEYWHYCGKFCEQVESDGFCAWGEKVVEQ